MDDKENRTVGMAQGTEWRGLPSTADPWQSGLKQGVVGGVEDQENAKGMAQAEGVGEEAFGEAFTGVKQKTTTSSYVKRMQQKGILTAMPTTEQNALTKPPMGLEKQTQRSQIPKRSKVIIPPKRIDTPMTNLQKFCQAAAKAPSPANHVHTPKNTITQPMAPGTNLTQPNLSDRKVDDSISLLHHFSRLSSPPSQSPNTLQPNNMKTSSTILPDAPGQIHTVKQDVGGFEKVNEKPDERTDMIAERRTSTVSDGMADFFAKSVIPPTAPLSPDENISLQPTIDVTEASEAEVEGDDGATWKTPTTTTPLSTVASKETIPSRKESIPDNSPSVRFTEPVTAMSNETVNGDVPRHNLRQRKPPTTSLPRAKVLLGVANDIYDRSVDMYEEEEDAIAQEMDMEEGFSQEAEEEVEEEEMLDTSAQIRAMQRRMLALKRIIAEKEREVIAAKSLQSSKRPLGSWFSWLVLLSCMAMIFAFFGDTLLHIYFQQHMKAAVGTPEATNPRGVRDNTEGVWWDALQPVRDHEAATGENANVPF